ncbi:unnamed protein product [Rotaria sordida]|uniref:Uncharacterized protein n=1 Tax=Rotaria sordida TaxID=392033 RepID=A0A813ZI28_9BILA|nr:unnamed protein product [Rotaria sordida]
MQQQVVSFTTLHNNDNKIDCFSYIVKQCHFYIENFGIIVKRVLCKPCPLLSKETKRKKKKQYKTNLDRNGPSSNITRATTNDANNSNMLADDDLPEIVSIKSTTSSSYEMVNLN